MLQKQIENICGEYIWIYYIHAMVHLYTWLQRRKRNQKRIYWYISCNEFTAFMCLTICFYWMCTYTRTHVHNVMLKLNMGKTLCWTWTMVSMVYCIYDVLYICPSCWHNTNMFGTLFQLYTHHHNIDTETKMFIKTRVKVN